MRNVKLIICLLFIIMLMGCTAPDVTPEPECLIIHEGGHYVTHFSQWSFCGCPSCEIFPRGTYWVNYDGTMFLIGDAVLNPVEVYGICPSDCVMQIN